MTTTFRCHNCPFVDRDPDVVLAHMRANPPAPVVRRAPAGREPAWVTRKNQGLLRAKELVA